MSPKIITDENFSKEVIESTKPVCVIFSDISFCAPCRQLHATVEKIVSAKKKINEEVDFGFADVNNTINEATARGVRGIPQSFLIFKEKILGSYTGAASESAYINFLSESLKNKTS